MTFSECQQNVFGFVADIDASSVIAIVLGGCLLHLDWPIVVILRVDESARGVPSLPSQTIFDNGVENQGGETLFTPFDLISIYFSIEKMG